MRAVLQRVTMASVTVNGEVVGRCGHGLLMLLGVGASDVDESGRVDDALIAKLWNKVRDLRIFEDENGKTNRSLMDIGGELLVVSQFTLYANCRHGRRPSFTEAGVPDAANDAYERLCELAEHDLGPEHVGRGIFGAMMSVELVNDGPFTIFLDTDDL